MPYDDSYFRSLAAVLSGSPLESRAETWDWKRWVERASNENILPALHNRIQETGVSSWFPRDVLSFLDGVTELNADRNVRLLSEIANHVRLLNAAGIQPVLLKGGAYLLDGVYSHHAHRYIADIDFLIQENELTTAAAVLSNSGYQPDYSDPAWPVRHHAPPLVKPGSFPVELHRSLTAGAGSRILPSAELIASSKPFHLCGAVLRLPCPDHLMTHLILHSQLSHHYAYRVWPTLRSLYDLILLQRRFGAEVNWRNIENRFLSAGHDGLLALHLRQLKKVLGLAVPVRSNTRWTALRWLHRKLLWRFPRSRFVDPRYVYAASVGPKIRLAYDMARTSGGWRYVASAPFRGRFYRKLVADLVDL